MTEKLSFLCFLVIGICLGSFFCLRFYPSWYPVVKSSYDEHQARRTSYLEDKFISFGGPICREEIHRSRCPQVPCMNFDIWYQKIYSSPSTQSQSKSYSSKKRSAPDRRRKVVLSVGHNGFGNQLFQHYFALQIALQTNSVLYLTKIDIQQSTTKFLPPHTDESEEWISLVSDPKMLWSSLPENHPDRMACSRRNVSYSKRPADVRRRSSTQQKVLDIEVLSFLDPEGEVECLISLGYFQNNDICLETAHKMWPSLVDSPTRPFSPRIQLEPEDLVLHIRSQPGHYGVPSLHSLQVILNRTSWSHLYIVKPSYTPPLILAVIKPLLEYPNSSVVKQSGTSTGFDDFILLSSANKIIEDVSTYSYWAGIFSNASEKHVNAPYHGILRIGEGNSTRLTTGHGFVYHDFKKHNYFGEVHPDGNITYRDLGLFPPLATVESTPNVTTADSRHHQHGHPQHEHTTSANHTTPHPHHTTHQHHHFSSSSNQTNSTAGRMSRDGSKLNRTGTTRS